MGTVSTELFLPRLLPQLNGAPRHVILTEIMGAIIEFCDETGIIQETLDDIFLIGGESEFELDSPPGTNICMVNYIYSSDAACFIDKGSYSYIDGSIKLLFNAPTDMTISVNVSTKPKRSSNRCDDSIYEDWFDGICAGVLFRMQSMIGREWENIRSAMLNEQLYRRQLTKAKHYARTKRVARLGRIDVGPVSFE